MQGAKNALAAQEPRKPLHFAGSTLRSRCTPKPKPTGSLAQRGVRQVCARRPEPLHARSAVGGSAAIPAAAAQRHGVARQRLRLAARGAAGGTLVARQEGRLPGTFWRQRRGPGASQGGGERVPAGAAAAAAPLTPATCTPWARAQRLGTVGFAAVHRRKALMRGWLCTPPLQGSQPWTHPGSSDSSDGGAKPARKASAGGSKKGRRPGRAPAVCQVEGCGVNLDGGKPFYRLQRICGACVGAVWLGLGTGWAGPAQEAAAAAAAAAFLPRRAAALHPPGLLCHCCLVQALVQTGAADGMCPPALAASLCPSRPVCRSHPAAPNTSPGSQPCPNGSQPYPPGSQPYPAGSHPRNLSPHRAACAGGSDH